MVPSGADSTAVTAAHLTPAGNSPQSRVVRYGCGRSLRGAAAGGCPAATFEKTMIPNKNPSARTRSGMSCPFLTRAYTAVSRAGLQSCWMNEQKLRAYAHLAVRIGLNLQPKQRLLIV